MNGAGNIVNENGEEPMDIAEDENSFKLEELTSYTEHLNARAKFLDAEILQEYQQKKKENAEKKRSLMVK
ncbi:unnamed protein product [Rhizopus stolonifer]